MRHEVPHTLRRDFRLSRLPAAECERASLARDKITGELEEAYSPQRDNLADVEIIGSQPPVVTDVFISLIGTRVLAADSGDPRFSEMKSVAPEARYVKPYTCLLEEVQLHEFIAAARR